jgi:hypothetical protein
MPQFAGGNTWIEPKLLSLYSVLAVVSVCPLPYKLSLDGDHFLFVFEWANTIEN